ncbi:hypothetical protein, partial [Streptomyces sp. NPDC093591]|uniref:hypothetical protein n=1 Tax=Streptomyces sp. NPDC093591 TaxID=3366044 RepID=UPI0037F923F9
GRRGIKPLWEFLAEFLAREFAWRRILCGLCRAAGAALGLALEFAWRQILRCGWIFGLCILPGGKISCFVLLGRWRGPFLGFWGCNFVGALVRSGC